MSDDTILALADPPERVETEPCYSCGTPVVPSPLRQVDEQTLCADCHARLSLCNRCERPMILTYRVIDGTYVCATCAADMYQCDHCQDHADLDDLTGTVEYPDGSGVCEWCLDHSFTECAHCHNYVDNDDTRTVQGGSEVCRRCRRYDFHQCDSCGEWVRDEWDCESCYDDYGDHGGLIESYGYSPCPEFHGAGPVYLGMELEVNYANYRCAELASEHLGSLGYLKEDGSLTNGFEIVTHPMSHEYARKYFPWGMLDDLRANGAQTDDDTGLHVHVSRKGFDSPAHVYRWMKLIYRNKQGVTAVARRSGSSWASFTARARRDVKAYAKGERSAARYQAINVQNYATFEVRVFESSLDRDNVQAALDLVAASVEYTRHLTVPTIVAGGWNWDAFGEWVAERPEYAALASVADFTTTEPEPTPDSDPDTYPECHCSVCRQYWQEANV